MIKIVLFIVLIFSSSVSKAQFDEYFYDKTLRVDYYHSGNFYNEYIKLDELYELNFWAGTKVNLNDSFDYGEFKIDVFDSIKNKLIFSHHYSSLFAEWRHTKEGKESCGNFSETVLIPFPKKTIKLQFSSRDSLNAWHMIEEIFINPKTELVLKPKKSNSTVVNLHYSGNYSDIIDIVFITEGYTKNEKEKAYADLNKFKGYLLNSKPFSENKSKFNIYGIIAISEESGITDPVNNSDVNTILKCSFNTFNSDRYLMTFENKILHNLLSEIPYEHIVIMCNTSKYGGGGIYNFLSTVAADNKNTNFLLIHEFGHSFAGLADEYYDSDVAYDNFYSLNAEPWEPNITTLVNFERKWNNLIEKDTPIPTKLNSTIVGVYEGAAYSFKGFYRPYSDCTMKSIKYNAFCPVCIHSIQKVIDYYSK